MLFFCFFYRHLFTFYDSLIYTCNSHTEKSGIESSVTSFVQTLFPFNLGRLSVVTRAAPVFMDLPFSALA